MAQDGRPQTLDAWLRAAVARLRAAGREEAEVEAELLLAHVLGLSRPELLTRRRSGALLPEEDACRARLEALVDRCAAGEPVAYLEGSRGFHAIELQVDPRVLIPRPDSECLVDVGLQGLPEAAASCVVDLGVGSGALLLALLAQRPRARGLGVDREVGALAVARANATALGLAARCSWLRADWLRACRGLRADLILCNPPYIEPGEELGPGVAEHEPHAALFTPAGQPYAAYEAVLRDAASCLRPGGRLLFEVGRGRAAGVVRRAEAAGLNLVGTHRDLGGVTRVVELVRPADGTAPRAGRTARRD